MDDVIDKLIELEYRAQKITIEAKEKEKTLSLQIKKKLEETEEAISNDYQEKIEEMKKREKLDEEQKLSELEQKKLLQLGNMETEFAQNHIEWENALFNCIIGR